MKTATGQGVALALLAGLLPLVSACSSGQELQTLKIQLADIQVQLLEIERSTPTKAELAELAEKIEAQREELVRAGADQGLKIDDLTGQVEQMQARLDDTTYRLAQLTQQVAATAQELRATRTRPEVFPDAGPTPEGGPPAETEDPETLYRTAYNDYLRGDYDDAMRRFRTYIDTFPATDLTDNAVYWYGECFYRQGKYRQAIAEFDRLLTDFQRSDKTPSAILKKGYAYLELNERAQGVVQLQHVVRQYPGSDESNLARQRLVELGVDSR